MKFNIIKDLVEGKETKEIEGEQGTEKGYIPHSQ